MSERRQGVVSCPRAAAVVLRRGPRAPAARATGSVRSAEHGRPDRAGTGRRRPPAAVRRRVRQPRDRHRWTSTSLDVTGDVRWSGMRRSVGSAHAVPGIRPRRRSASRSSRTRSAGRGLVRNDAGGRPPGATPWMAAGVPFGADGVLGPRPGRSWATNDGVDGVGVAADVGDDVADAPPRRPLGRAHGVSRESGSGVAQFGELDHPLIQAASRPTADQVAPGGSRRPGWRSRSRPPTGLPGVRGGTPGSRPGRCRTAPADRRGRGS